jgi:hypothetical protein
MGSGRRITSGWILKAYDERFIWTGFLLLIEFRDVYPEDGTVLPCTTFMSTC